MAWRVRTTYPWLLEYPTLSQFLRGEIRHWLPNTIDLDFENFAEALGHVLEQLREGLRNDGIGNDFDTDVDNVKTVKRAIRQVELFLDKKVEDFEVVAHGVVYFVFPLPSEEVHEIQNRAQPIKGKESMFFIGGFILLGVFLHWIVTHEPNPCDNDQECQVVMRYELLRQRLQRRQDNAIRSLRLQERQGPDANEEGGPE